MPIKVSEDLRGMADLKSDGAAIVKHVTETGRTVVLTKHGRGVAVVMSVAAYEEQQQQIEEMELRLAVRAGEADFAAGRVHEHEDVMRELDALVTRLSPPEGKSKRRARR